MSKTYMGWANRETWIAYSWLYEKGATVLTPMSAETVASELRARFEEQLPAEPSWQNHALQLFLDRVNWHQIATILIAGENRR